MGVHDQRPHDSALRDSDAPARRRSPRRLRRSVLRGAFWSVPAVAPAAVPSDAADIDRTPVLVEARISASLTTDRRHGPRVEVRHTIPPHVISITFEVLGGGGGCGGYQKAATGGGGGDGHLLRGTLAVTPGDELVLIAGNGGSGPDALDQDTSIGGQGYGRGGDSPAGSASRASLSGGSGGGGSAILRNGIPAVVAGGGGGVGSIVAVPPVGWTYTGGAAGDAEAAGVDIRIQRSSAVLDEKAHGGGGASGATPGAPRGEDATDGTTSDGWRTCDGIAGSAPNTLEGGDGATGMLSPAFSLDEQGSLIAASGGGGGGYAGGASGETRARVHVDPTGGGYQYAVGAPGGGGSSYISPAVSRESIGFGTNGAQNGTRGPGSVTIRYEISC